ncbi:DUF551 domain-containing protein [Dickeya undicola]|uniref:DUF551 domain-containing protein n=1 Tax=Dickeya undicola TaxID=1577887 RepID=A0A3N0G763_9GAMM|nr:DUF551 domain-containing protein [Dickeya undicola]
MPWISVDERKPETTNQFELFLIVSDKGIGVAHYDAFGGFGSVVVSGNVHYSHHVITHWAPLPKPPSQQ